MLWTLNYLRMVLASLLANSYYAVCLILIYIDAMVNAVVLAVLGVLRHTVQICNSAEQLGVDEGPG